MADPIMLRAIRRAGRELSRRANTACVRRKLRAAGVAGASSIPTYTTTAELEALYMLASRCPSGANALEIGSYMGASACYIAAGLAQVGGRLYCNDTWQNHTMPDGERDTMVEFNRNTAGVKELLQLIRKPSSQLNNQDVPVKLDLVFIDGDHTYEGAKTDFNIIAPWLTEKAIVAFHDHACFKGVAKLVGDVLTTGSWRVEGFENNLIWLTRLNFVA